MRVMSTVALLLSLLVTEPPAAAAANAKPEAPPAPDLPALLACRQTHADWMKVVDAHGQTGTFAAWGWRPKTLGDGFLEGYTLKTPIHVFGQKVTTIAFSSSGVVAVLKEGALPAVVRDLKLESSSDGPTSKVFGRVVSSSSDQNGSLTFTTKVALTASTSAAYPRMAFVGCSYSVDVN
jgi:hypothetical protein